MSLFWRVFAVNAVLLVTAAVALALSPATVSFPVALTEALVLGAGLGALLVLNLALLERVFRPLRRLAALMRGVDPLSPGERAPMDGADAEMAELTGAFNEMVDRIETERRESARRALAAQESERVRIARELHDEVGQALTSVMLRIEAVGGEHPELAAAREDVRGALEEVRGIAGRLRPGAIDDLGLAAAVRSLATGFAQSSRILVERAISPVDGLEDADEVVIYRVAQEALTNVARHARATRVRIELAERRGEVVLRVGDDGQGFEPISAGEGAGIRGMRERALLAGAALRIDSAPERGTRVELMLTREARGEGAHSAR